MRNVTLLACILSSVSALQISPQPAAFLVPFTQNDATLLSSNDTSIAVELKRQLGSGGCPAQYNACLRNGYGGACCTVGSFCTTDVARNVACCPNGATCTGTLGGAFAPNTGVLGTSTTNNGFGTPVTTAPVSLITNPYFPFPIIAVNYPEGSTACETALTACQANYAACNRNLQGGGFGVTVVAPNGGGVTQAPTVQNLAAAQATSICQSLSQQACHGLTTAAQCAQFGAGNGNGGSFVVSATGNVAARATAAVGCVAGMVAGLGVGMAGQFL